MANGHGKEQSSGEQSVISVSTEQLEDTLAGLRLAESNDDRTPEMVLHRMLSCKTAISTGSSFASRMRRAQEQTAHQIFTKIGAGACGEVFQQSGTINMLKRAKTARYASELWEDYLTHTEVQEGFARRANIGIGVRIPKIEHFVSQSDEEWWDENESKFPLDANTTTKAVSLFACVEHSQYPRR